MARKARSHRRTTLSKADEARLRRAKLGYEEVASVQILQWVSRARHYVGKVAAGDTTPEVLSAFWICVYGVIADVRDHVRGMHRLLTTTEAEVLASFQIDQSMTGPLERILESIEELCAAFDEDELAYLEYRRHVECHPLQDGYEITVRDGAIIDRRRRLTGRTWTFEEEDAALKRIIKRYGTVYLNGVDENPIARVFAERIHELVGRVDESLVPVFGVRHFNWIVT